MTDQLERLIAASSPFVDAMRMARALANEWRKSASMFSDEPWKLKCAEESRKAFERARWYIGRERIRRRA